jgi:hypothetical protein
MTDEPISQQEATLLSSKLVPSLLFTILYQNVIRQQYMANDVAMVLNLVVAAVFIGAARAGFLSPSSLLLLGRNFLLDAKPSSPSLLSC